MKRFGFVLALLAAFSMTIFPAARSIAAQPGKPVKVVQKRDGIAVLTDKHLDQIKAKRPALHAKILAAQESHKTISVTAGEARFLQAINNQTLAEIKAG